MKDENNVNIKQVLSLIDNDGYIKISKDGSTSIISLHDEIIWNYFNEYDIVQKIDIEEDINLGSIYYITIRSDIRSLEPGVMKCINKKSYEITEDKWIDIGDNLFKIELDFEGITENSETSFIPGFYDIIRVISRENKINIYSYSRLNADIVIARYKIGSNNGDFERFMIDIHDPEVWSPCRDSEKNFKPAE